MNLGKVVGTIVTHSRNDRMNGPRYLLIARADQFGNKREDYLVALDNLGAGYDELVMVTEGSPARETPATINKPCDALIVGIIDVIEERGKIVYRK
jgi:microcompartment protein CcmK/EutM